MINLLPPKEQADLMLMRQKRLIIVLGSMAVISLIFFALVLLSLKFYVLESIRFHESADVAVKTNQDADLSSFKSIIQKYNTLFSGMNILYKKQLYVSDAFFTVLQVSKPAGLSFTALSARRENDSAIAMDVSGSSDTRDNLLLFKQNLESSKGFKDANGNQLVFKDIYFPPESWIKPDNVDFHITFRVIKSLEQ